MQRNKIVEFSLSAEHDKALVDAIRAAAGCDEAAESTPAVGLLAVHARLPEWTDSHLRHGLVYLKALKRVRYDEARREVALIPLMRPPLA